MTKQEIRNQLRQIRKDNYDSSSLSIISKKVTDRLEQHPLFRQAQCILLFHSLPDEVNTHELIEHYHQEKTILLPTVIGDDMELHIYQGGSRKGAFDISESTGPLFTDYDAIDLAAIPGVGFDREGNRLGRGKGYYDRFLPLLHCHTIGICYPFQLVESIPTEPHDIKVNEVIS